MYKHKFNISKDALEYIYVGLPITRFSTDSPVVKYISPMGNNNVPYPTVFTRTRMISMSSFEWVDNESLDPRDLREFTREIRDPHMADAFKL